MILRNVLENPGWYTPYTPYQAEIAQGRLEALLNFQTMVRDLTGMDVANASLLDEATAAAEAMTMLHRVQTREAPRRQPRTCSSSRTPAFRRRSTSSAAAPSRSASRSCRRSDAAVAESLDACSACCCRPGRARRRARSPADHRARARGGVLVAVATDLLALTLLTPPGEMGADVVVGNSQRFGVPLGYGGPHAAFFATREAYVRQAPGRIIGVSVDAHGHPAYRMALQTREQHIRREKATSNICTAQALLANIAAIYAVYHGPTACGRSPRACTDAGRRSAGALAALGFRQLNAALLRHAASIDGADAAGASARRRESRGHQLPLRRRRRSASRSTRRSTDEDASDRRGVRRGDGQAAPPSLAGRSGRRRACRRRCGARTSRS